MRPASVVPLPAEIVAGEGVFQLRASTPILVPSADSEAAAAARYLADLLSRTRGLELAIRPDSRSVTPAITFARQAGLAAEGYRLEATPGGVRISATSGAGLFYGAVTLWQLLPPTAVARPTCPHRPSTTRRAYAWRGLMLDSARHFQSPQFVKSMLDWMAWHKLNVLHWHLTDDQGWRLEIESTRVSRTSARAACPPRLPRSNHLATAASTHRHRCATSLRTPPRATFNYPRDRNAGHAQAPVAAYPALGAINRPGAAGLGEVGRASVPVQRRAVDVHFPRGRAR